MLGSVGLGEEGCALWVDVYYMQGRLTWLNRSPISSEWSLHDLLKIDSHSFRVPISWK